jgi:hypothetical protein
VSSYAYSAQALPHQPDAEHILQKLSRIKASEQASSCAHTRTHARTPGGCRMRSRRRCGQAAAAAAATAPMTSSCERRCVLPCLANVVLFHSCATVLPTARPLLLLRPTFLPGRSAHCEPPRHDARHSAAGIIPATLPPGPSACPTVAVGGRMRKKWRVVK